MNYRVRHTRTVTRNHCRHCARRGGDGAHRDNNELTRDSSTALRQTVRRRLFPLSLSLSLSLSLFPSTLTASRAARLSRQSPPRAARPRRDSPLRSLHPRSSTGVPAHACFPEDGRPPRSGQATHSHVRRWVRADTHARAHTLDTRVRGGGGGGGGGGINTTEDESTVGTRTHTFKRPPADEAASARPDRARLRSPPFSFFSFFSSFLFTERSQARTGTSTIRSRGRRHTDVATGDTRSPPSGAAPYRRGVDAPLRRSRVRRRVRINADHSLLPSPEPRFSVCDHACSGVRVYTRRARTWIRRGESPQAVCVESAAGVER